MKALVNRGRKILSNILRAISVSVASLILQACYGIIPPDEPAEYGMPPPEYGPPINETSIYGKVQSKETGEPIFGIKVSIEGTEYWKRTDEDGRFYIYLPVREKYKLKFEDVDGTYNGGLFKDQTFTLNQNDTYYNLLIGMDLVNTETDAEQRE